MRWCVCGHLRSDVVRCPTEGRRPKVVLHVLLTHAEVCDLYVTRGVQQHVIQLQISTGHTEISSQPLVYCLQSVPVLFL